MRGDQGLEFYTVWGRGFKCRSTAHVLFYCMTMEESTCSTKLGKENEGIAEITYSFFFLVGRAADLPWSFIYFLMVKLIRFTGRLYVWYDKNRGC